MSIYTRLSIMEREKIYQMKLNGESVSNMAKILGRDKSTIYREIKRNSIDYGYNLLDAHKLAKERMTIRVNKIDKHPSIKQYISIS
jgi:transposase, IS30 family